jgi:NAD(P)H-hydrate epimerase
MRLPHAIHSAAQVRALDEHEIRVHGTPGYALMKRAGEASLRMLRVRWPTARTLAVACGAGNNGGDGYVLARFARAAGLAVLVLAVTDPVRLAGDARLAWQDCVASGVAVEPFSAAALAPADVVVDAVLGTGLGGDVRGGAAEALQAINASGRPVLALDLPSGLCADTGHPRGVAVRADATVTFVGLKTGLFLGDGPDHVGTLYFDDLGVRPPDPPPVPRLERIAEEEIAAALPRRPRSAHKGSFGSVVVVGGGPGMPGAAALAGEAALRVGAGRVTVLAAPGSAAAIASRRPELIVHAVDEGPALRAALEGADVIAAGPGLGRGEWGRAMLAAVLEYRAAPLVMDADALNLLADGVAGAPRSDWVLTPHPGEAARLLGSTTAAVQADRLGALESLCARWGGVVVLKGAGTLVGAAGRVTAYCERGNPGMAVPGMGDVLTGAIAGILGQCRDPWRAARVSVLVHALAGDSEARAGQRGMLAGEVARGLRHWVNPP